MLSTIKTFILLILLLPCTACVSQQSVPTMLDYTYVPPSHAGSTANYGIDDF